jgi:predicted ribosome quality control (RQC) complex YloA/Tae2 family protein
MREEKGSKDDEDRKYIEELAGSYSRKSLDEIAIELEINPHAYASKAAIAKAILKSRENERTARAELVRGLAPTEEVKGVVEMPKSSVMSMRRAFGEQATAFKTFGSVDFKQAIKSFNDSVRAFGKSIGEQMKMNQDFLRNEFKQEVQKFRQNIKKFEQSIDLQAKENHEFARQFQG